MDNAEAFFAKAPIKLSHLHGLRIINYTYLETIQTSASLSLRMYTSDCDLAKQSTVAFHPLHSAELNEEEHDDQSGISEVVAGPQENRSAIAITATE